MAHRGCVIFVGNLPGDVREREIEDLFYKVTDKTLWDDLFKLPPHMAWCFNYARDDMYSKRSLYLIHQS